MSREKSPAPDSTEALRKTQELAISMKLLADRMIFTAELFEKFSNMVVRLKALNPLVSDELVSLIGMGGKQAREAVELVLSSE